MPPANSLNINRLSPKKRFANKLQTFLGCPMRLKHIAKRGSRYQYVCRVPQDLKDRFPSPVIYRTLNTTDEKAARVLAASLEYDTQQLFMQLRSTMLSKDIEKRLIALYLQRGVDRLEEQATGQVSGKAKVFADAVAGLGDKCGFTPKESRERFATFNNLMSDTIKDMIADQETYLVDNHVDDLAARLNKHNNIKLTAADKKALSIKFLNAGKQLYDAESAMLRGDWSAMEAIKTRAEKELSTPYCDFMTVLEKYQADYIVAKPNVKPGTIEDMQVECRVLLEIIGNTSIEQVNTMTTVTKLKTVLRKYPKNRVQRFGDKSIHTILKNETGYEIINPKTANEYIKRFKSVLDFAGKHKWITSANVAVNELFQTDKAEEEQRLAYDADDITRLIDAMCTKPLWRYNPAKPERFWIILIALFHGLRLGNIVGLTKRDVCQTDKGTWVFALRKGKSKATVRPVAICDSLQLLGFLDWVENLDRDRLFQDSADSFSKWYNRTDTRPDGTTYEGFEAAFITKDKKKCLYSLRHSFAGNVFDVTDDFKLTADMMGHSTGGKVTARYTKATKAETLKEVAEKMNIDGIDLDRLEIRAKELFGI